MTNAIHDQNFIKSKLGVLFSDGNTLIPIKINSSNNGIKVNTTDTVNSSILAEYVAGKPIPRDTNGQLALCGQSSANAAVTLPLFVDADGGILIET